MPCPLSDAGCTLRPSLRRASAVVPSLSRASRRTPILQWRGWDSNPRSRAHEAREDGPSSTARGLAGWSRTSDLRCPKPAGWPLPYSQVTGRGPGGARKVDDRGIEPRSTAVSERRFPSRPVVGGPCRRRQGLAPCLPGSQPGGSLLAVRRSLAGRIRTPVPHGRSVVLTTELRRERNALDGSRTRLARQTTGSRLQTRPRACCDAVPRAGIEPALPV